MLHPARTGALLLCAFLLCSLSAFAQTDTLRLLGDTSHSVLAGARDTSQALHLRETKSPWLSVGLSAAFPGAGQIYTKSYWKLPLIWGLGGYYIYEWVKQNGKYKDFRDRYSQSITPTTPQGSQQLLNIRNFYRDQRDSFAWYMGFLYFLNLVDAYVDAQLYDFDVSPVLTEDGRVVPSYRASIRIPLR